jgi:hypothetical protein
VTRLYRRRTAPIEAMLYDDNADEVIAWCGGHIIGEGKLHLDGSIHPAQPGDYIIRVNVPGDGSRYFPMPTAMFEHSYEEIT